MIETHYFGPISSPLENITVGRFVCNLIKQKAEAIRDYCTLAVMDDGKLIGGTIYHGWIPETGVIELTSAALDRRWMTRPVINATFDLPFNRFGCQLVALRVAASNERMVHIARSFGANEYFIPRLRGRDDGEFIFTVTDEQWASSKFRRAK